MNPKLKFQLNIDFDKWTCDNTAFHNSVIRDHPSLAEDKNLKPEVKKAFNDKYVEDYYKTHKKELDDAMERMKNDWLKTEDGFFEVTNRLFSHAWPKGEYICYLSIFNCNPRVIETKVFQAFYEHPETTNHVCVHEMLHFIFYDYLEKNFSQEYKQLGDGVIWKLSEIFNDVVLRLPEFVAITGQKNPAFYAETKQELNDAFKLWGKTKNIKAFVTKYFELLK